MWTPHSCTSHPFYVLIKSFCDDQWFKHLPVAFDKLHQQLSHLKVGKFCAIDNVCQWTEQAISITIDFEQDPIIALQEILSTSVGWWWVVYFLEYKAHACIYMIMKPVCKWVWCAYSFEFWLLQAGGCFYSVDRVEHTILFLVLIALVKPLSLYVNSSGTHPFNTAISKRTVTPWRISIETSQLDATLLEFVWSTKSSFIFTKFAYTTVIHLASLTFTTSLAFQS